MKDITKNKSKTLKIINYIVKKCQDEKKNLGATRLNKILWFADLSYFKKYGKTITKEKYLKRKFGPAVGAMVQYENTLKSIGDIKITKSTKPMKGYEYTSLKDKLVLDIEKEEINALDESIEYACKQTAAKLSDITHDPIYHLLADDEEMPIEAVAWWGTPTKHTTEDMEWSKKVVADYKNGLYK